MDSHSVLPHTAMEVILTVVEALTMEDMAVITDEVVHHRHQKVRLTTRLPLLHMTKRTAPQLPRRANHHLEHLARDPLKDVVADADQKENTVMDTDMDHMEESVEATDLEVAVGLKAIMVDLMVIVEVLMAIVEVLMDIVVHHGPAVAFPSADVALVDSEALATSSTTSPARLEMRTSSPRPTSSTQSHPTSYIFPSQEPRRKTLASLGTRRRVS